MKKIVLLLTAMFLLNGCAKIGGTLEGQYYLNKGDWNGGREAVAPRLAELPDDPVLNYYMARFELGADNPEAALPRIQKAVRFAPANADYHFWEGVTWWALMQPDKEKEAYEKALAIDPDHLSANLYLAHNLLDRGKNEAALDFYNHVLALNPEEPQAMFNKAVALERMKRPGEMRLAMRRYLDSYPGTALARRGTEMLNRQGDFSWRNHVIGLRTIPLKSMEFAPETAVLNEASKVSLNRLGDVMSAKADLKLHVVAYVKGNKTLARQRALAVRDYVAGTYPEVSPDRLTPSWFDVPENIKIDGKPHKVDESVAIFTKVK